LYPGGLWVGWGWTALPTPGRLYLSECMGGATLKKTVEYFTVPSTGQKIRIRALSPDVKRQLEEARNDLPDAPTYAIIYPGGEEEQVPHDPTTVETEEERAAWQKFVETYNEATTTLTGRWAKVVALLCILDLQYPEDWKSDFEYLGIVIPEDPREQRMFFVNNVLLPTDEDKELFAETIHTISTIRREDLQLVGLEFRDIIPRYSVEKIEDSADSMDDLSTILGSESDGTMEHNPERVGSVEPVR